MPQSMLEIDNTRGNISPERLQTPALDNEAQQIQHKLSRDYPMSRSRNGSILRKSRTMRKETQTFEENNNLAPKPMLDSSQKLHASAIHKKSYEQLSLNAFTMDNSIRQFCISLVESRVFQWFIYILIFINAGLLGSVNFNYINTKVALDLKSEPIQNQIMYYAEPVFISIYGVEALMKIIAHVYPSFRHISILKAFTLYMPFRQCQTLSNVKILIDTLLTSMNQLWKILLLNSFLILIFSIIGLQLLSGVTNYRCRQTQYPVNGDWLPVADDPRLCGGMHSCEIACGSLYETTFLINGSLVTFDLYNVSKLSRDSKIYELEWGLVTFDNILKSLLTIFLCTTQDKWATIMDMIQDGYNFYFASIFFPILIILCSYFLLTLTVAIFLNTFNELNKIEQERKGMQNLENEAIDMKNEQANGSRMFKRRAAIMNQETIKSKWEKVKSFLVETICTGKSEIPETKYYSYKIPRFCFHVVESVAFKTLIYFLIIVNTIAFIVNRYPMDQTEVIQWCIYINWLSLDIYILEIFLKIVGYGLKGFMQEPMNAADLVIVIAGLIQTICTGYAHTSVLIFRALRTQVINVFQKWESYVLLKNIVRATFGTIISFTLLLTLFVYIYALIGMKFFAGTSKFDTNGSYDIYGHSPRTNFDTLLQAVIAVFQIIVGEDASPIIANYIRVLGWKYIPYFVLLIIIGQIIITNLFLALILGKFEELSVEAKMTNYINKKKQIQNTQQQTLQLQQKLTLIDKLQTEEKKSPVESAALKDEKGKNRFFGEEYLSSQDEEVKQDDKKSEVNENQFDQFKSGFNPFKDNLFVRNSIDAYSHTKNRKFTVDDQQRIANLDARLTTTLDKNIGFKHFQTIHNRNQHSIASHQQPKSNNFTDSLRKKRKVDRDSSFDSSVVVSEKSQLQGTFQRKQRTKITPEKRLQVNPIMNNCSEPDNSSSQQQQEEVNEDKEVIDLQNNEPPEHLELIEFESKWQKTKSYMMNSSLFIFHQKSSIRQFCKSLMNPQQNKRQQNTYLNNNLESEYNSEESFITASFVQDEANYDSDESSSSGGSQFKQNQFIERKNQLNQLIQEKGKLQKKNTLNLLNKKLISIRKCLISPDKIFDNAINISIIMSAVLLISKSPAYMILYKGQQIIEIVEKVLLFVFLAEVIIKVIAFGFIKSSNKKYQPYLLVPWNCVDLFLVIIQITEVNHYARPYYLPIIYSCLATRSLRLLRYINKNDSLKIVINSLMNSLPALLSVILVIAVTLFMFGVIGVDLLKGQFYSCDLTMDSNYLGEDRPNYSFIITKFDCLNLGGEWVNADCNFDNVLKAMATLFQFMLKKNWIETALQGVDAMGIGLEPQDNAKPFKYIYFIVYLVIGHFFIFNLFTGVVINSFNRMKDKICGYVLMTQDQRNWIEIQRVLIRRDLKVKQALPENYLRRKVKAFADSQYFQMFIVMVTIINTSSMALLDSSFSHKYNSVLGGLIIQCTAFYNLELVIRLFGDGKHYFKEFWNVFDFVIIFVTNILLVLVHAYSLQTNGNIPTVLKAFKILKALRLFRVSKNNSQYMKLMIDTLVYIIPHILNICFVIFLFIYIYAIIGMNFFSGVMYQTQINEYTNFRGFGASILLLFKCLTVQDWSTIMNELSYQQYTNGVECITYQPIQDRILYGYRQCGSNFSYFYFISFMVLIPMIFMNLFIAIVLERFQLQQIENSCPVTQEDYDILIEKWGDYDKEATGWISLKNLAFLIFELPTPLGRKFEYKELIEKTIEEEQYRASRKKYEQGRTQEIKKKFIIKIAKDMILPQITILKLFKELKLPVYFIRGKHMCHFKDVCIKLSKIAISNKAQKSFDFDKIGVKQVDYLNRQWARKYKSLNQYQQLDYFDTGRIWAGLYIIQTIQQVFIMVLTLFRRFAETKDKGGKTDLNAKLHYYQKQKEYRKKLGKDKSNTSNNYEEHVVQTNNMKIDTVNVATVEDDEAMEFVNRKDRSSQALSIKPLNIVIKRRKVFEKESSISVIESPTAYNLSRNSVPLRSDTLLGHSNLFKRKASRNVRVPAQKDTERSTWWMSSNESSRMDQWMKNQEARVKKNKVVTAPEGLSKFGAQKMQRNQTKKEELGERKIQEEMFEVSSSSSDQN